jgi:hypothetical protein
MMIISVPLKTRILHATRHTLWTSVCNNSKVGLDPKSIPTIQLLVFENKRYNRWLVLPPFINIRCFKFIKQMYLDTF